MTETSTRAAFEVWLLETSVLNRIPLTLENLLESITEPFNSSQDGRQYILAILVYYVTLEMGFSTQQEPEGPVRWGFDLQRLRRQSIPQDFKHQTYFRTTLFLPGDSTKCTLLIVKNGELLLVTLTSEKHPGGSVNLSTSRFVPYLDRQNPACSFRYLMDLSQSLRRVFLPVMNAILAERGQIYPGLMGLPELDVILNWLDRRSLKALALTDKRLAETVANYRKRKNKTRFQ